MGVFFMEKQGFVYIWYDKKRKMYYVGCHWGTENDGYICSSTRMLKAYNIRPNDFKRRIVKKGIKRNDLLTEEYRWLSMIKDEELNDRYYNTQNHHFNHWINSENKDEIKQKCGEKNKGRKQNLTPEQLAERGRKISDAKHKKKLEKEALGLPIRKPNSKPIVGRKQSEEEKLKKSISMKKAWQEGRNQGTTGRQFEWSEERKQKHFESVQGCHGTRDSTKYSIGNKKAWQEGKYKNRRSNNMKDFIWVTRKSDGTRTRINSDVYDEKLYIKGKK